MYRIQCECGKPLSVAFGDSNKVGRCPWCSRMFTIPAPVELTTGKLRCQCGLVMDYDYQDAGLVCECIQCKTTFKIPGGTADSMASELDRELITKRAEAYASKNLRHQSPGIPLSPVFESLGEFQPARRPIVFADYERFGFERMIAGIALLFMACVTVSVIAMWAQGLLGGPNRWLPQELSSSEVERTEPTLTPPLEGEQKVIPIPPPERPSVQPEANEIPGRWVHIGEIPPSVSLSPPAGIGTAFASEPLTKSELESLANQIVIAVNTNSSRDLTEQMDPEVLGNYLFQHAKIPAEQRFQLGAEAIALYANHPRISEQLPDAQAFPAIRMGQSMVPLIRVCNNSRQGSGKLGMGPKQPTTLPAPSAEMKRATAELVKEYDRLRQALDSKLPSRFGVRSMVESSGTNNFQRTPLNDLLDHPAVYFAVIATRSRSGKPVLLDLACVNYDLCLLEATWNAIDRDKRKKSFQSSRPQKQNEVYFKAFRESVGETRVRDIFTVNSAFDQIRTYKREAISIASYPEESTMADAGPEDCLNALETLESLFPNDMHNFMLQCLTLRDARFDKEARLLLDRLVEMKYSNVHFYDDWMNTCTRTGDAELARQIIDALKANCLR